MKKNLVRADQAHIMISPVIFEKTLQAIEELEGITDKNILPILGNRIVFEEKSKQKLQKLTIKMFTEAALNYFVKHKIDPRFFDDSESLTNQVVRLRNQIFSFLKVQEQQHIMPLNGLLVGIKLETEQISKEQAMVKSIFAQVMALSKIFIETLDLSQEEAQKVQQKFDNYYEKITQAVVKQYEK